MTVGDNIKAKREEAGLGQTELANMIHISKQTLYKYENNIITNIPSDKIEIIAKVLDCSPAYLMGWENSNTSIHFPVGTVPDEWDKLPFDVYTVMNDEKKLLTFYRSLNNLGREKAIERISELTVIPKYTNNEFNNEKMVDQMAPDVPVSPNNQITVHEDDMGPLEKAILKPYKQKKEAGNPTSSSN